MKKLFRMKKNTWLIIISAVVVLGLASFLLLQKTGVPAEVDSVIRSIFDFEYSKADAIMSRAIEKAESDITEIEELSEFFEKNIKQYMTDSCYKRVMSNGIAGAAFCHSYETKSDINVESIKYIGNETKLGRDFAKYEAVLLVSSEAGDKSRATLLVELDIDGGLIDYMQVSGVDWIFSK